MGKAKEYSLDEIAKHNTEEDCWLVIHGKVYDVTEFLPDHPGGPEIIVDLAGKDATDEFEDIGHSEDARQMMAEYEVGEIEGGAAAAAEAAKARKAEQAANGGGSSMMLIVLIALIAIGVGVVMMSK